MQYNKISTCYHELVVTACFFTIFFSKVSQLSENKMIFRKNNSHISETTLIRIAYQTCKTSSYFPNKDRLTDSVKSHIIYQFNCGHCGGCYTGETTRHLSTRVAEHISGRPVQSEVSLHQHVATKENFKAVLKRTHTKIGEAVI